MAGLGVTLGREEEYLCGRCGRRGEGLAVRGGQDLCYHLECTPVPPFLRLDPSLVSLDLELPCDLLTAQIWIQRHNQYFQLPTRSLFSRYSQRLPSLQQPIKRALIEAFKYVDRREIALMAGPVCKEWYYAAWNRELWGEGRVEWLYAWKVSCVRCGKRLEREGEIGLLCPDSRRLLCVQCRNAREMMLISIVTFCRLRGISPSLAHHFRLPGFQLLNKDVTFMESAALRLQSLRHTFRRDLLAQLAKARRLNEAMQRELLSLPLSDDFDAKEHCKSPYVELIRSVLTLKRPRSWPARRKK